MYNIRNKRKYTKVFIILIAVTFVIAICFRIFVGRNISYFNNYLILCYKPFEQFINYTINGIEQILVFTKSVDNLREQNAELKSQNQQLRQRVTQLNYLEERNYKLEQFLGVQISNVDKRINAKVIGNVNNIFIINKGFIHGVKENMTVITPAGLVGKISQVNKNSANVLLINNPKSSISARVLSTRELVLIKGTNNILNKQKIELQYIPLESELQIGDLVVTSGIGILQPEIVIGNISDIKKNKNGTLKKVFLESSVNLSKIEEVIVID